MAGTLLTVTPKGCEVDSSGMEETDSSSRDIVLVTSGTGLMSLGGGLPALSVFQPFCGINYLTLVHAIYKLSIANSQFCHFRKSFII